MNLKKVIASAFIASILFVSCKKELEPQEGTASETELIENNNQLNAGQSIQPQDANQPQLAGMNPPHGEPNHRCDIAVGAPLSSEVGTASDRQAASQVEASEMPVTMPSETMATPAGMNPPHGQAGHRCEIAVGAPLPK